MFGLIFTIKQEKTQLEKGTNNGSSQRNVEHHTFIEVFYQCHCFIMYYLLKMKKKY